jgi:hypothetical protein
MRILGIIAIFVLTLVAILEGAALVRLSSRVDSLVEKLGETPAIGSPTLRVNRDDRDRHASTGAAPAPPRPPPRLMPAPTGAPAAAAPGPATTMAGRI